MSGSVSGARWAQAAWLAAYLAAGLALLVTWARDLDALALGEEPAAALGVPVERAARRIFLAATLLAAATVAAAGWWASWASSCRTWRAPPGRARTARCSSRRRSRAPRSSSGPTSRRAPCAPPPSSARSGHGARRRAVLPAPPLALARVTRSDALHFDDVVVRYRAPSVPALDGVSLGVRRGLVTAVVGPNGSGKSTLVRALLGRVPLARGRVRVDGIDAGTMDARERARQVAVVPQREESAFPLPVREYVGLGRLPHGGRWGGPSRLDREAVAGALADSDALPLADRMTTSSPAASGSASGWHGRSPSRPARSSSTSRPRTWTSRTRWPSSSSPRASPAAARPCCS
jgi:hypothetical protein